MPPGIDQRQEQAHVGAEEDEHPGPQPRVPVAALDHVVQVDPVARKATHHKGPHEWPDPKGERQVRRNEVADPDDREEKPRIQQSPAPASGQGGDQTPKRPEAEHRRNLDQVIWEPLEEVVVHMDEQDHPRPHPEEAVDKERGRLPPRFGQQRIGE